MIRLLTVFVSGALVFMHFGEFSSAQHAVTGREKLLAEFSDTHTDIPRAIRDTLAAHAVDAIVTYANAIRDTLTIVKLYTNSSYIKRITDSVGIGRDVIVVATTGSHMSPVHVAVVSGVGSDSEILLDTVLWAGQGGAWIRQEHLGLESEGFCTPVIGQHCGMTSACFCFLWTDGKTAKVLESFSCKGFELRDVNGDGLRDVEVQYGGNLVVYLTDSANTRFVALIDTTSKE